MHAQAATQDDRAAAVAPPVRPAMPWRVCEVHVLPDYRLSVRFMDGLSGIVDLSALVASPSAGVFARLRDHALFAQAHVAFGAVTWPGGLDLAPDAMHAAIARDGECKLT